MATSSTCLSSLPPELLIAVFTSLDGFSSLASLCRVSHGFYDIWKSHTHTICREIAVRTIGFVEALELAELQSGGPGARSDFPGSGLSRREASIAQARHLAANHRIALLACELWEKQMLKITISPGPAQPLPVSCREKFRFQQAYYHLTLLTLLPSFSLSIAERLDQTSLRALEGAFLVTEWLRRTLSVNELNRLGVMALEEGTSDGFGPGTWVIKPAVRQAFSKISTHRAAKQRRLLGEEHLHYLGALAPLLRSDEVYFAFFDRQQHLLSSIPDLC